MLQKCNDDDDDDDAVYWLLGLPPDKNSLFHITTATGASGDRMEAPGYCPQHRVVEE